MKIGFDARLIGALGIGRYIASLLPLLSELLGDRLLVFSRAADLALLRALTAGRGTIEVAEAPPYRLKEQSAFLVALLRARASLVHFPHYNVPLGYGGRFVVTIHDLFSFRYPEIHSGSLPRLVNQTLIRNAVRRAGAIITPSRATAEEVSARFPSVTARIVPIPEATSERFTAERNLAAETAWQHYFGIHPPYFLYLGQWKAYKNVPLLIEAFARVRAARPEAQLVITGNDPRHGEIPRMASALPEHAIVFPGHVPDDAIPELYRGAAAVVVPSRAEGFGLPVLEGMACGVPVVASDIPVLREVAGEAAIFADPSSTEAFAGAMLAALDAGANTERRRHGIERAQQFSWRTAAEKTLAVYERVLAGRPSRRSDRD